MIQSSTDFDDAVKKLNDTIVTYADVMRDLGLKLNITMLKHIESLGTLMQNFSFLAVARAFPRRNT